MTTATLKSAIPTGAILTQHVKQDFDDYVAGRPVTQRLCVWRGQVSGVAIGDLDRGRSEAAKFSTIDMIEVTDPRDVDTIQRIFLKTRAEAAWESRQPSLFDATDEEIRESLLDMIKEHASEQDIPIAELDKQFVDYFGGSEHASAETVQACRSNSQLKEFAYKIGAIAETKPDAEPDNVLRPPFAEAGDQADDSEPDDDATADET